jgi:nitrate reductase alpha subunit
MGNNTVTVYSVLYVSKATISFETQTTEYPETLRRTPEKQNLYPTA